MLTYLLFMNKMTSYVVEFFSDFITASFILAEASKKASFLVLEYNFAFVLYFLTSSSDFLYSIQLITFFFLNFFLRFLLMGIYPRQWVLLQAEWQQLVLISSPLLCHVLLPDLNSWWSQHFQMGLKLCRHLMVHWKHKLCRTCELGVVHKLRFLQVITYNQYLFSRTILF